MSSDAKVLTAHCDYMADLGESCMHIAAVLFKIEAAVRLGYTSSAPTDEPCQKVAASVVVLQGTSEGETETFEEHVSRHATAAIPDGISKPQSSHATFVW